MAKDTPQIVEDFETEKLSVFSERAYLDYSMYVILDRALPFIGDGLKPVQRRIIYAMSELGLSAISKHKKSARTVGDVIGKFHPHGDASCYESMVVMAQPFTYRYPIVDGQGNWGSADDPKSFAAMRYTESRLTKFSEIYLSELGQGTVDFVPNFDATLQEPKWLPARLPALLLNGVTGIAVGLATDIPPHNVKEVTEACLLLLDNPKASLKEIMEVLPGPDYPTGAELISSKSDIQKIYETGNGTLRMRAKYEQENGDIVITELPHQVSGAKILEQIANQMRAKKLPQLLDLRDESDHENPTRLILVPRSNRIDVPSVMDHLFATTELERTYRANLNAIDLDGRPRTFDLKLLLQEWLSYRTQTVTRRLQYRLERVVNRLHILDGLMIAYLNIDEVIEVIRNEDKPKPVLIKRFQLSDIQAESILDLKLRHLAKLEEMKIQGEQDELNSERESLEKTLNSKTRLKTLIRKELKEAAEKYGDARKSPIVTRAEAKALSEKEILTSEPVTVVISTKGWVRSAKGHDIDPTLLSYKSGDEFRFAAHGKSTECFCVLDSTGRAYTLSAHNLPSARSQGEPLTGRINPPSGATFEGLLMGPEDQSIILGTDAGFGFRTKIGQLVTKNRAGKAVITVGKGAKVLLPLEVRDVDSDHLVSITNDGRCLIFPVSELPELAKGKGNRTINIPTARAEPREEWVIAWALIDIKKEALVLHSEKRKKELKKADLSHYLGERGRRGSKLPRSFQSPKRIEVLPL